MELAASFCFPLPEPSPQPKTHLPSPIIMYVYRISFAPLYLTDLGLLLWFSPGLLSRSKCLLLLRPITEESSVSSGSSVSSLNRH